jgi:hypothetical protein
MRTRLKHKLPLYSELPHLSLTSEELTSLKNLIHQSESNFKSVLEINKGLCGIHHTLASTVYDNFFQIGLTDSEVSKDDITLEECELSHDLISGNGIMSGIKNRVKVSTDINSPYNEKTYTKKNSFYHDNAVLFDGIFSRFKSTPTRIRLVKLLANTNVSPHIDYDPSYSVRVIIPIISPSDCLNIFWQHNTPISFNMGEGIAYFLNTGYRHAVVNLSKEDRYTLLISVDGTNDIDALLKD